MSVTFGLRLYQGRGIATNVRLAMLYDRKAIILMRRFRGRSGWRGREMFAERAAKLFTDPAIDGCAWTFGVKRAFFVAAHAWLIRVGLTQGGRTCLGCCSERAQRAEL